MSQSKKSLSILSGTDYRAPRVSAQRAMGKVTDIASSNPWEFFCTLTWREDISRDYYGVQKRALEWKKDIEKGGGKVLLVIGCGDIRGLYHVHALVNGVPEEMIIPGSVNAHLIEVKTNGALWSLSEPEKHDVGLHVMQEISSKDDYYRCGCYMAGHIPELRRQFYDGIMANTIDRTTHMYYASRGLKRSIHAYFRTMNTADESVISNVYNEEMTKAFEPDIFDNEYYAALARIRKRITHKISIFCNHSQGAAVTIPEEIAHMITDVTIPDTMETYTKHGKCWCRFTGTLKQLLDALYLSYIPSNFGWEGYSANLSPYFS